jgi:uncharacterized protein YndB with AHSA1/START domain
MADLDAASERELVLSRRLDAPRARVFDAWLDPGHIGQWWGPNGFSTDIDEMDVRVGGVWRFTMHGPDGTDYRNRIVYTEVQRPERLGYEHGDGAAPWFNAEVTFAEEGEGTLLTLRMICKSAQQLEEMKQSGAEEGGAQTLERLARYLAGYGSEM